MLENYQGKSTTFKVPSGHEVTIREQTGDDDDILSLITDDAGDKEMITNINKFVLGITTAHDYHEGILTYADVIKMKLKDKHHIMLKSRIFSLGKDVRFKIRCSNPKCKEKHQYVEDLSQYDNDFKTEEGNGFKYQVKPYPEDAGEYRELTLSSNKKIRYKYFNGEGELYVLELSKSAVSKNTEFVARSLEILDGAEWKKVSSFGIFSSRDMAELRADLEKGDSQFLLVAECECPTCKNEMQIPFIQIKDFFFPLEITNM